MSRRLAALGALAALLLGLAPVASAATLATFGNPTARSTYGSGIEFDQPVTIQAPVARVELLLTVADAIGPSVIQIPAPTTSGSTTLSYVLATIGDGHLVPNTQLVARWRLIAAGDSANVQLGPTVRVTYADDRFTWQTEAGALVRGHWYQGGADFGQRALKIGEDGLRRAADLLGVTISKPIDFFVYADQTAFYDALGPGTRENVGGEWDPSIRTLFALIPPNQINDAWVGIVIPHELTHAVFATASDNPYHQPPRWLNEGVAVYESQGYDASDRGLVASAVQTDGIIPLQGLVGLFPASAEPFFLAYAESVSAVDFIVRTYGSDGLVKTIRAYKDGRTDDEAFQTGLGVDTAGLEAAWLADIGAKAPARLGPQPAPAGPIPPAWLTEPGAAAPAASTPAGTGAAATAIPAAPAPGPGGGDSTPAFVALLGVIVVLVLLFVAWRARRGAREGSGT